MSSTVIERCIVTAAFALFSCVALAKEAPPRILQEPIFGLQLEAANPQLELLPDEVRNTCFEIADNERMTGRAWVYASVREANATYYVVAGYFKRSHPAPGERRYRVDTYGGVYRILDKKCVGIGAAREVFDVRPFNEIPQPILQQLAVDLAARLTRAFGGHDQLRAELRKRRTDLKHLSPELQQAFRPYFGR